jgi:hypothetical protein
MIDYSGSVQLRRNRLAPLYSLISRRRPQSSGTLGKGVGHAILDVFDENSLRLGCIAG